MSEFLRKMSFFLEKKHNAIFLYDVKKQNRYIEKFRQPRDEIERAYFQYKCQMKLNGVFLAFLLNLLSFPVTILYFFTTKNKRVDTFDENKKDACFFRDGKPENILPLSLREKYTLLETNPDDGCHIGSNDKKFIRQLIKRYPFSWHFILKCFIKIRRYSFVIEKYSPKAIIVCAEYSFTSSVLTAYCRERDIRHIDVMHGEKLYYIRDSFFEFDECYVWDDYYANLFISLKASPKQFIVEIPDSLRFGSSIERIQIYDYTYYLANETEETLKNISCALNKLNEYNFKISVRPHPRYSNIDLVNRFFAFADIQNTDEVTIEQSLLQTGAAISLYSTVLNQASYNSVPVIIDDISNSEYFEKLKELRYICFNKKHMLLSEIFMDLNFQL